MPKQPPFDAALLERLPGVLAIPLQEFAAANLPELRLHRLCDAIEIVTRFCTFLAVAEVRLPDDARKLPDQLVKELGPNIQIPTFARWLGMAKGVADFLAGGRSNPMVLPELPRFIRDVLLPTAPPRNRYLELSILELRNTLAHGGCMTGAMAEYLLHGDASGHIQGLLSSVPAEVDAEDADEAPSWPAEAGPLPGETTFHGWEPVLGEVVKELAALLEGSRLCSFDGEAARDLTGLQPSGDVMPLSADLRVTLRRVQLQGHVLLFRDGRWLDLWPLCDHGKARLMSLRGQIESEDEAPLLYYRVAPRLLLYAAFGTTPPVSERDDAVAEFQALFRTDQRQETAPQAAVDFAEELQSDAKQMIGRATEFQRILEVLDETPSGVLWLYGTGGVGKSCLTAKVAVKRGTDPRRWCCIPWRFRVSDADRSNRNTFLRYAVARLAAWKPLGRADLRPDLDSNKLPAQLDDLLRAAGSLPPGKDGKPPRVLFVLDGMDEAARLSPELLEWPFRVEYDNVVWLCAGRPGEATSKAYAPDRCRHLFPGGVAPMSTGDVRAMLYQQLGEQKYELLGLDRRDDSGDVTNPLVEAIIARSEGLPLYVHFLVADLLTGHFELTRHLKSKLPQGLAAYYEDLLTRAQIDDVQAILPKLLGTIVWARGPVAGELLFELLRRLENERPEKWDRLRADIQQALLRAASLVRPGPLPEGELGYVPCHTTFQDHFRTNSTRLGRTNDQVRDSFVQLTNDWRNVAEAAARRYVFRHGPRHLLEEDQREQLYVLGRDEAFLGAQAAELAGEPEAPLGTLQAALTAAGRGDDAAGMAEFLLRHAKKTHALQTESPLTALRRGDLDRALRLADLTDAERSVVYNLLLAWELCESGRTEETRQVLERLARRKLPRLTGVFASAAAAAFAPIAKLFPTAITDLARGILEEEELEKLIKALIAQGLHALAHSLTGYVTDRAGFLLGELAAAQAQAGQAAAARHTLEQALQTAPAIDDPARRADALRGIAAAQAQAGQAEAAGQTAQAIDEPFQRAYALGDIAAAQAQAGQAEAARLSFEQAVQTAQAITDPYRRAWVLHDIAARQAQAGQVEAAQLTLEQALQTAPAITDPDTRADALRGIAAGQAKTGQAEVARRSFELAVQSAQAIDEPSTRAGALQHIAVVQAQAGQAEAAGQTAQAIDEPSRRADAFRRIAAAQVQTGQAEVARRSFEQALQTAHEIDHLPTRADALRDIAVAQAKAGQVAVALQTAQAIVDEPSMKVDALRTIAAAQAQAGQAEAARLTFEQALRAAHNDYPWKRADTLRDIAVAQAQAGQAEAARLTFEQALQTAQALDEASTRAEAFRDIAAVQARAGQAGAAFQTAQAIDHPSTRAEALRAIVAAQAQAGQAEAARRTFELARQAAQEIHHSSTRAGVLRDIAAAQAQAGQADAALQMVQEIDHPYTRAYALRDIAAAQARAGQAEAAFQTAQAIDDPSWRAYALRDIAAAQARAGQAEAARRTFELARQAAQGIDYLSWRTHVLGDVAAAQARAGQAEAAQLTFEQARQTAQENDHPSLRADALRDIAAVQAQAGQVEAALQATEAIDDPSAQAEALGAIAAAQAHAGQAEAARRTLEQAFQTAQAIDDPSTGADFLRYTAAALAEAGQAAAARFLFEQALQAAQEIDHPADRAKPLKDTVKHYYDNVRQLGYTQETAQRFAQAAMAFSGERDRAEFLGTFACILATTHPTAQAIATANLILVERETHLPRIVASLLQAMDRAAFKDLLIPCAAHLESAWKVCGLLAQAYPEQASAIAQVALRFARAPG